MRIVFINMHTNGMFVRTLSDLIWKRRAITKHRFLLNFLLEKDIKVVNFITSSGSTLPTKVLRSITDFKFLRLFEAKYVLKKAGVQVEKIIFLNEYEKLNSDDIVIFYGHFNAYQFDFDPNAGGYRVGDLIHFYGDSTTAENLRSQNVTHYIAEVDLCKYCGLFRKNYNWLSSNYIPRKFSFEPRFKVTNEFRNRKNKAVAMGTLTKCFEKDFLDFFGSETYQPKREMIYRNMDILSAVIDSFISPFNEGSAKIVNKDDAKIVKTLKKYYNFWGSGRQKSYFSFDVVEKYNEYQMFICPEDAVGQYGIGVIEGMACGCAMIGWDYGVYEDLGMKAGIHYISYNGTIEDLKKKIEYYQTPENYLELKTIAENGCKYVRHNFSQEAVALEYIDSLNKAFCN